MSLRDNLENKKDDEKFSKNKDEENLVEKAKRLAKKTVEGLKEEYDTSITAKTTVAAGKAAAETTYAKIRKKTNNMFKDIEKKAEQGEEYSKFILKNKNSIEKVIGSAKTIYDSFQKKVIGPKVWKVEEGIPAYDTLSKIIGEESKILSDKTYEKPSSIDGTGVIIKKTTVSTTSEPNWYERTIKKIKPVTLNNLTFEVSTHKTHEDIQVLNVFLAKYDTKQTLNLEALSTALGTDALKVLSNQLFYDSIIHSENPNANYVSERTVVVGEENYSFEVSAKVKDNLTHIQYLRKTKDNEIGLRINITKKLEEHKNEDEN